MQTRLAYSPKAGTEPPRSFTAALLGWAGEGEGADDTNGPGHIPTAREDLKIQMQDYRTSARARPGIHLNICFHASAIQRTVQGMSAYFPEHSFLSHFRRLRSRGILEQQSCRDSPKYTLRASTCLPASSYRPLFRGQTRRLHNTRNSGCTLTGQLQPEHVSWEQGLWLPTITKYQCTSPMPNFLLNCTWVIKISIYAFCIFHHQQRCHSNIS